MGETAPRDFMLLAFRDILLTSSFWGTNSSCVYVTLFSGTIEDHCHCPQYEFTSSFSRTVRSHSWTTQCTFIITLYSLQVMYGQGILAGYDAIEDKRHTHFSGFLVHGD